MSNNDEKKNKLSAHFTLALIPLAAAVIGVPGAFIAPEVAAALPSMAKAIIKICSICVMLGLPIGLLALKKLKDSREKSNRVLTVLFSLLDMAGGVLFIFVYFKYMVV